jgi:hypothetical protein
MPTEVRVPARAVPILRRVARLDKPQHAALIGVFRDTLATSAKALIVEVDKMVDAFSERDCVAFVGEMLGLSALGYAESYSLGDIAESVANSPNLELTPAERATLLKTLSLIMDSKAIEHLGKAFELSTAHERVFHSARIMTDSRPLFEDVDSNPIGVVITHALIVEFHQNGQLQSMEVSLSGPDLELLQDVVNRASHKAVSLDRWARDISLRVFEVYEIDKARDNDKSRN